MRIVQELPLEGAQGPAHRIDTAGLADILDVSPSMLTELKKRQIAVPLGLHAFDLTTTVRNYVRHLRGTASGRGGEEQVAALTTERARLAKEQADAQALKNAALRGALVEAAAVERAWGELLRQVRSRVLAVPSRLRGELALDAATAEAIDRELRLALEELGRGGD